MQVADRRADRLLRCYQFGIATIGMVVLDHPSPAHSDQCCRTKPIGRVRVSGFAQSGFNEVAHSAKIDPQRRATSQNPPDSQGA